MWGRESGKNTFFACRHVIHRCVTEFTTFIYWLVQKVRVHLYATTLSLGAHLTLFTKRYAAYMMPMIASLSLSSCLSSLRSSGCVRACMWVSVCGKNLIKSPYSSHFLVGLISIYFIHPRQAYALLFPWNRNSFTGFCKKQINEKRMTINIVCAHATLFRHDLHHSPYHIIHKERERAHPSSLWHFHSLLCLSSFWCLIAHSSFSSMCWISFVFIELFI